MKPRGTPGNQEYDAARIWRLPAGLSGFALLVLPCAFLMPLYEAGSFLRDGLALLVALGACSCLLGLGLGLWIALRTRRLLAVLTWIASLVVAAAWWGWVFQPLVSGP